VAREGSGDGIANKKFRHSDIWRIIGLAFFSFALVAFIAGCVLGAIAVLAAKS
jgi:hypothetical protein